jgi:ATP-binding cassette subfamily B protein
VNSTVTLLAPRVQKFAVDDLTQGVTRAKLFQYATLLVGIAIVAGYFRFLMRRILIGASRHIEYDLRNDFFAKLEELPQRSERCAHDDWPGRHVFGKHGPHVRVCGGLHGAN